MAADTDSEGRKVIVCDNGTGVSRTVLERKQIVYIESFSVY
jgi:hypothetical protein